MIDLDILKKRGITSESLKKKLSFDPNAVPKNTDEEQKVAALHSRIRSRVQEGMSRNFADFRVYHALDTAWDQPFNQITPTLVQQFINSDPNKDDVYQQMQSWGLSSLITTEKDPKSGKDVRKLNIPVFFNIFVPLVRAYVTIRWAKIMNDRRMIPFFKYEPIKSTAPLKLKCEVITDIMSRMSNQYGYYDVMKQSVIKMLHYSFCFQFPQEEWHSEEQWKIADKTDVALRRKGANSEIASEGTEIKVTAREGLRYHHPHPSRIFWDMAHGKYTYNYDSGCMFAGYWRIQRYRDVHENPLFWNRDKVTFGSNSLVDSNALFFQTVYSACQLQVPTCQAPIATPSGATLSAEIGGGSGTSPLDREKQITNQFYGNDHLDRGVLVTEYYEKLVPKDNGLGDYDCPVWFRFVLAGDGATILYAAPLPYNPVIYYGYDAEESRSKNASLSLEILPFQDQFGNVLTQILLTAKQNLANLTAIDTDQIDEGDVKKVENLGGRFYQALNLVRFSGKKFQRAQLKVPEAIQSYGLPKGNVAELTNVLKTLLDVLERILVMSSHEAGQPASHEQTREEVRVISGSTSTRLEFTATPVDIARDAWKRQIYAGYMAYGDEDCTAHVPADVPLTPEIMKAMGFTAADKDEDKIKTDRHRKVTFKKDATAIDMSEFSATRDGEDRQSDEKVATAMSQIVQNLLNNPMTAQAIGPDQAIDLANQICQLAGLPRDFKLRNVSPNFSAQQQQQQAQQQLMQVTKIVLDQVNSQLQKELIPLLDTTKRTAQEVGLIMQVLARMGAPIPQAMPPVSPDQAPPPMDQQPPPQLQTQ